MERMKITAPAEIPFEDLADNDADREDLLHFYYEYIHIYYEDLYRWILFKAPKANTEVAEEIHQETIVRALEYRHQLRDFNSSKAWLFSIAGNVVAAYYRSEKKWNQLMSEEYSSELSQLTSVYASGSVDYTLEEVLEHCETEILMECLKELTEEQQYVIRMHHYQDMTFREIAERLGENEGRIYGWYRRGCARLRRLVKKKGGMRYE